MLVRPSGNISLGWKLDDPLNMVLVQPFYAIEPGGSNAFALDPQSAARQRLTIGTVLSFLSDSDGRVPHLFRQVRLVVLPEFSVPYDMVQQVVDRMSATRPGMLLVAGIERQSLQQYGYLVETYVTDGAFREQEIDKLTQHNNPARNWVNAALVAWRDGVGTPGVLFQRKICPSNLESQTLCTGDVIHTLRVDGALFGFAICSDLLDADPPPPEPPISVAQQICEGCVDSPLDVLVHVQYNPKPRHTTVGAGTHTLLTNLATRDALVVRVNRAASCEEHSEYGVSGAVVGRHRSFGDPPECCCVRDENDMRWYDMRPQRACAFLLQTYLPSAVEGPQVPAGQQPVRYALWLPTPNPDDDINFTLPRAASPEPRRFGGWRAFEWKPWSKPGRDLLKPTGDNEDLHSYLKEKYQELRRAVWGDNGRCLSLWAEKAVQFHADTIQDCPDHWHIRGVTEALRKLVAGMTLIHAGPGLAPIEWTDGVPPRAAMRFAGALAASVHCRDAASLRWPAIKARLVPDAQSGASHKDWYVVSNAGGHPCAEALPYAGLVHPAAATYGVAAEGADPRSVAVPCVLAVPVGELEDRVLDAAGVTRGTVAEAVLAIEGCAGW